MIEENHLINLLLFCVNRNRASKGTLIPKLLNLFNNLFIDDKDIILNLINTKDDSNIIIAQIMIYKRLKDNNLIQ